MTRATTRFTQSLFAPLATNYERWARILSMGQDPRWRRHMVAGIELGLDSTVLDIAAGTGSITRLIEARGAKVVSLDQSQVMLAGAVRRGALGVVATAEALPFPDAVFDVVTFGYLLRYVQDVEGCMNEISRVLRPGGHVGMLEFGRPDGIWHPAWWLYTRIALPLAGLIAGRGWFRVGRFLGPSIDSFYANHPPGRLASMWQGVGLDEVHVTRLSLGGGLVMHGKKT